MGQIMNPALHKVLYFAADPDSDQDFDNVANLYAVPASAFRGFNIENSYTAKIDMYFEPQRMSGVDTTNDNNAFDKVTLNITTNKHKEVCEDIVRTINSDGPKADGFIVMVDDMLDKRCSTNITSIQAISISEPSS
jgi:hypothetical protein